MLNRAIQLVWMAIQLVLEGDRAIQLVWMAIQLVLEGAQPGHPASLHPSCWDL